MNLKFITDKFCQKAHAIMVCDYLQQVMDVSEHLKEKGRGRLTQLEVLYRTP